MVTPRELRDLNWILGALQTAVALEHATMPPYLAAMYSLEVQNYPSYNTIRSVIMEEMLHMAALCNMLAGLGGSPRIRTLEPGYPRLGLPGEVAPDLRVLLASLSPRQLDNFMRLEAPTALLGRNQRGGAYPTIDDLYDAIRETIVAHATTVRGAVAAGGPANQVGGNIGYETIQPESGEDLIEHLLRIIDMITSQGQGDGTGSLGAGEAFEHEISHYARFAELRYGRRYVRPDQPPDTATRETVAGLFTGDELVWPVVINTLAVPADGYAAILDLDPEAPDVRKELEAFDAAYTAMMVALDDSWNGPPQSSWPRLGEAVVQMNEMRVLSCFNILRHEVPPAILDQLEELYPDEYRMIATYSDLTRPVFYGPRFRNLAASRV